MAELAHGSVADRPWGRTFATLGLRGLTGQLTLIADGKRFLVAFDQGAVVAAASPLTSDAAVRVALTSHLVSSSQVPEIARRLASAPERDEVDVIAEQARLGRDHALRLRRRVIAQRAARTFSINQGEFFVTDEIELAVMDGCELDVRAVVYMGARTNLSEARLSAELGVLGGWFRLKPGVDDDLPQFGFTDVEQPVVERLRDGGTLAEIEAFATSFVDERTVRAVVYALASCSACEIEPAPGKPRTRTPSRAAPVAQGPQEPAAATGEPVQPLSRTTTQPLTRTPSAPIYSDTQPQPPLPSAPPYSDTQPQPPLSSAPPYGEAQRPPQPPGARPRHSETQPLRGTNPPPHGEAQPQPLRTPGAPPRMTSPPPRRRLPARRRRAQRPRPRLPGPGGPPAAPPVASGSASAELSRSGRATPGSIRAAVPPEIPEGVAVSKTTTARVSTAPPPARPPALATGSATHRQPEIFDAPTWRDADEAPPSLDDQRHPAGSAAGPPRQVSSGSSGSIRPPGESEVPPSVEDARWRATSSASNAPSASNVSNASSASIRLPGESEVRSAGEDVRRREGSSASIRLPGEDVRRREGPSGSSRPPSESGVRALPLPGEDVRRREGPSGSSRPPSESGVRTLPGEEARRRVRAGSSTRSPGEDAWRDGSSSSLRLPTESGLIRLPGEDALRREAGSGVIRLPDEEALQRDSASGVFALPSDDALRDGARRASDEGRRRQTSSTGLKRPLDPEAGPGVVVRRVSAARPQPARQVARVDTPQSHEVKALIAQRLKMLDQGADHFQLLGVGQDVAADALRKAYFALARQLHPDRLAALGISDDGRHAQRLFAQINAGFAILSDQRRRASYLDILRRGGEAAVRAEQARAEEMTRRILEAEEAFRRGELALRRDQPSAAVVELERAVQLNPDETDYHAALAWSRFCAAPDRTAAAAATRSVLERAIQRAPRSVTARFYLGRVERMLGRDQDALRHFRDVLAASPGHAEAASEVRALEARLGGGDKPGGSRPRR